MENIATQFMLIVMAIGIFALVVITIGWVITLGVKILRRQVRRFGTKKIAPHLVIVLIFALPLIFYGSTKSGGGIIFPQIDPNFEWLVDDGSYVSNNVVHVAYKKHLALPDSADLRLARKSIEAGSIEWDEVYETTVGESPSPFDYITANATSFVWAVYTTYTPGPAVITNGVLHVNWAAREDGMIKAIPLHTEVLEDGVRLATPSAPKRMVEIHEKEE